MSRSLLILALGFTWGVLSLPPAVSDVATNPSSPRTAFTVRTVSSQQSVTTPAAILTPSSTVAPVTASAPASPEPPLLTVAQLTYPVPSSSSAATLLQAALDYAYYNDWDHYRQYLEAIIASYPETIEAGQAQALLADLNASQGGESLTSSEMSASDGAMTSSDSLTQTSSLADGDPEVQAFSILVNTVNPAIRAKQYREAEQILLGYLQLWHGTSSGGWAALRLGDVYRFNTDEPNQAMAVYQQIITEYGTGSVTEEALVAMAETLNWSESGREADAKVLYEQALSTVHSPGMQVRALLGLGDMLSMAGEYQQAMNTLSQIIAAYPTHPSAAQAYSLRSIVAEKQGNWAMVVADMRAFLTYPSSGQFMKARAHWVLAQEAFRQEDIGTAETEFNILATLANQSPHTVEFIGEAQAGLAACAQARGDLLGALHAYQLAADGEYYVQKKAVYLYLAADLAQQLNDLTTRSSIMQRMSAELPGSHLTTQLVGHEVLPTPEI